MTTQTDQGNTPAEHAFQITHYIRPASDIGGWHTRTTAEFNAADAHQWIDEQQADAVGLGLADAPAVLGALEGAPADPPQETPAAISSDTLTSTDTASATEPE